MRPTNSNSCICYCRNRIGSGVVLLAFHNFWAAFSNFDFTVPVGQVNLVIFKSS